MSIIGTPLEHWTPLPKAYEGCTCACHTVPKVFHVMPCCYPTPNRRECAHNCSLETISVCLVQDCPFKEQQ